MDSGLRRNDKFEHFSLTKTCFAKASAFNMSHLRQAGATEAVVQAFQTALKQ